MRITCLPLENIIQLAYVSYVNGQGISWLPIREQWVRGDPSWIWSAYSIDAKPEGAQTAAMMLGPMLQALLEDRFRLRIHREIKEMSAYALVVAEGGPKLEATKEGSCTPRDLIQFPQPPLAPGQPPRCGYFSVSRTRYGPVRAQGSSMTDLCGYLSARLSHVVVDKTGITGVFDIELIPTVGPIPDLGATNGESETAVSEVGFGFGTALQNLGLRLESDKATVETIVIDHIERPSEN